MFQKTIPFLLHPNFTKIASLIIGYSIWALSAHYQWVCIQYSVPICFYQTDTRTIQAPESVIVKISGARSEMFHLTSNNLAIHLNVQEYQDGDHEILLDSSNLFLPETLKLVELIPSIISFNIQSIPKKNE